MRFKNVTDFFSKSQRHRDTETQSRKVFFGHRVCQSAKHKTSTSSVTRVLKS